MPTGYTANVQDGKITTFKEFAHECSRAFGAHILMRDNPSDPLPKKYEIADCFITALEEAKKAHAQFMAMSGVQWRTLMDEETAQNIKYHTEAIAKRDIERQRYEIMLAKAKSWAAPTKEHVKFREFMIEQLTTSIDFDCHSDYHEKALEKLKAPSYVEWCLEKEKQLKRNLDYAEKSLQEEIERTNKRNDWIAALEESLQLFEE